MAQDITANRVMHCAILPVTAPSGYAAARFEVAQAARMVQHASACDPSPRIVSPLLG